MGTNAGDRIGPYEILTPIGAGGMGEVFRARDARLHREVAIKVLPLSFAEDEERRRRFEQEARAVASLNHPNILTVFDVGSDSGVPYLVTELLEGETLRERLADGPIPPRKAVEVAVQLAHGLAAAHEKGIAHRDLKPDNIVVMRDGRVKILDFGLAKVTSPLHQEERTLSGVGTTPGLLLGTVGFMAPEQVRGEPADHRSDIFALGAILYEMLTGGRAFLGDSTIETLNAILKEDPPAITLSGTMFPPQLEKVVRRCLEKSPQQRFQSARDLAYALEMSAEVSGLQMPPSELTAPRKRRLLPVAVGFGAILALLLAADLIVRLRPGTIGGTAGVAVRFARLTDQPGVESYPSLSPDGTTVAYAARKEGQFDIFVQRVGGHNPINLTPGPADDDTQPAYSPDGQRIAFRSDRSGGGIFVMGATGEALRRVSDIGFDPAWSPDGRFLVVATEGVVDPLSRNGTSELWTIDVGSGERRRIYAGDAVQPSWSPHGHRIAFWALQPNSSQRDIWTIPAEGLAANERPVPVTSGEPVDWDPVWSPDGGTLYFGSDRGGTMNLWRVGIDESSGHTTGEPEAVTVPAGWSGFFSLSRNGHQIAYVSQSSSSPLERLQLEPRNAGDKEKPSTILETLRTFEGGAISPDGKSIVVRSMDGYEDLFVVSADGGTVRQVTDDPFRDRGPSWAPDGHSIVFYSDRGGSYAAWSIATDGSGLRQLTRSGNCFWFPIWSPDGRSAALSGPDGGCLREVTKAGTLSAEKSIPRPPEGAFWPQSWSRDGRRLSGILAPTEDLSGPVATLDVASGTYHPFAIRGQAARFLDDTRLVVLRDGSLFEFDTRTGEETTLLHAQRDLPLGDFRVSPDGRWLTLLPSMVQADIWHAELP